MGFPISEAQEAKRQSIPMAVILRTRHIPWIPSIVDGTFRVTFPASGRTPETPEVQPDIQDPHQSKDRQKERLKQDEKAGDKPEPEPEASFSDVVYQNGNPLSRIESPQKHQKICAEDSHIKGGNKQERQGSNKSKNQRIRKK